MKILSLALFGLMFVNSHLVRANEDKIDFEVIEVKAHKRVQSIQAIPIALTAIKGRTLQQFQALEASQVASFSPNVNVTRSIGGAYNYFIRGVGMDDFNLSSVPAVGLYVDDVAIQNPMLANFSLSEIEQVEVLRGPQNTVYGKNTTGGVVNFVSKTPTLGQESESILKLYAGDDQLSRVGLSRYFSFSDTSAMSISAHSYTHDGRVNSSIPSNPTAFHSGNQKGFKLGYENQLSDKLNVKLALYGGRQKQISEVKVLLIGDAQTGLIDLDDFDLRQVSSEMVAPRNNINSLGGYLKLNWDGKDYDFRSISSFEQTETARMDDWGSQSLASGISYVTTYNSSDTLAYTQEFQLLSAQSSSLPWFVGLLFNHEGGDILQTALIDPAGPGRPDDNIDDAGIGPLFDRGAWVEMDSQTLSAYGHVDVPLANATTLSLGYRYSIQDLQPTVHSAGMLMDSAQQPFPLGTFGWYSLGNPGFDVNKDYAGFGTITNFVQANNGFSASTDINEQYREWGGKMALTHQLSTAAMFYASIAKGFKMGAVNSNPTTAAYQSLLDETVTPERLISYEVGLKSDWLDRKLRVNAAVFRNHWQDYQLFLVFNPGNPADLFASLVNLPEAETDGFELEASANLTNAWSMTVGIGYLDAKITDANLDVSEIKPSLQEGFQDSVVAGNRLPNAPKWTVTARIEHQLNALDGEWELAMQYQYKDKHIHALAGNNSAVWQHNFSEQAVNLVNLSARYTPQAMDHLSLHMSVRNLFDEQYCSERAAIPGTSTESVRLCAQGAFRELVMGLNFVF